MRERFEGSQSNWQRSATSALRESLGAGIAITGGVIAGTCDRMKKSGMIRVAAMKARGIPKIGYGLAVLISSLDDEERAT